jgi:hypothetical protein
VINASETFEDLRSRLLLNEEGRLTLNGLPMILLPRHFFRYIMRDVQKMVGPDTFRKMFEKVGYDGAVTFCDAFRKSHGCSAKEAFIGYLNEMSIRGWGHFKIEKLDELNGEAEVLLTNSALPAEGELPTGNSIWEGAVLGAMAYVQDQSRNVKRKAGAVAGHQANGNKAGSSSYIIRVTPAAVSGDGG